MEKKELWKVLGRDDYARKSQDLRKKCDEMAIAIRDKLIELDVDDIFIPKCGIILDVINVSYVATFYTVSKVLAIKSGTVYYLLQDIGVHDRLKADNLDVKVGRVVDAVDFVGHLDEILQKISEIEDKKVACVEKALKSL